MKALLKKVHQHVEKKNMKYAFQVKKKDKKRIEPGNWVCVHLHKERFPRHRKSKLMLRGNGSFIFLKGVNAYKWTHKASIMLVLYSKFLIFISCR